jgi:hypothetical protein
MTDAKPDWKKGDLLAMPVDLQPHGTGVACGCHVFVADRDPQLDGIAGTGWYGFASTKQFRKATKADLDRLIGIAANHVHREVEILKRLVDFRKQFFESDE